MAIGEFFNTFREVLLEFLATPQFISTLGWIFGTAMIVGGAFWWNRRGFKFWLVTSIVFIISQEYLRWIYLTGNDDTYTIRPVMFVAVTAGIFGLGIFVGMILVWFIRKDVKKKSNGHHGDDEIFKIFEPVIGSQTQTGFPSICKLVPMEHPENKKKLEELRPAMRLFNHAPTEITRVQE